MPVVLPDRWFIGPDSAENRGTAAVAVPTVVLASLVVAQRLPHGPDCSVDL